MNTTAWILLDLISSIPRKRRSKIRILQVQLAASLSIGLIACVQTTQAFAEIAENMMPKPTIALSAAVVVFTTFAAMAKDNYLPSIDIKKGCGIRAKASAEMMGDKASAAGAF